MDVLVGKQGPAGPGLTPLPPWEPGTYAKNVILSHNNSLWMSLRITAEEPSLSVPLDWALAVDGTDIATAVQAAADAAAARDAAIAARDISTTAATAASADADAAETDAATAVTAKNLAEAAAETAQGAAQGYIREETLADLTTAMSGFPDGRIGEVTADGPNNGTYEMQSGSLVLISTDTVPAIGTRLTTVEANALLPAPALDNTVWGYTATIPAGGTYPWFGFDRVDGFYDLRGSLRDAIDIADHGEVEPNLTGYARAWVKDGKLLAGRTTTGAHWFYELQGPTIDALQAAIDAVDASVSVAPDAPSDVGTVIADDVHGRSQVFGITADDMFQLTWEEAGVGWQQIKFDSTSAEARAFYSSPVAGGQGRLAGWDGDISAEVDDNTIHAAFSYGQSLSIALVAAPSTAVAYVLTTPDPSNVMMFSSAAGVPDAWGPNTNDNADAVMPLSRTDFLVDAVEMVARGDTGMAAQGTVFRRFGIRQAGKVVVSAMGRGSQTYVQLRKGTIHYTDLMTAVDGFAARATALGRTPIFANLHWEQGESDNPVTQATYAGYMDELATDFDGSVKSRTGQLQNVRFSCSQMGHFHSRAGVNQVSEVALAQLERGLNHAAWCCIGPKYGWATFSDSLHLESESYLELQVRHAMAHAEWERIGTKPLPLYINAAPARNGTAIVIPFHVRGELVVDTTRVTARTAWGITARRLSDNSLIPISDQSLTDESHIAITLSTDPGEQIKVGIAMDGSGGQDTTTNRASNIRDTYDLPTPFQGRPLYPWACHQEILTDV